MRILYVAMKYDYGKPDQGYSFEHYNFYHALLNMGHDILYFDFMSLMQQQGRDWMNRRLLEVVRAEKPDLMFTVLFTEEFDPAVVKEISENTDTITLNWFCDDHWRFDNFSRHWAPCFNWSVTTARSALPKFEEMGYKNVIKSQWACNPFLYRKMNLPLKYDVTFVGQPHGNRRETIQKLREAGIDVQVWGGGWDTGRISQEEMMRVFNQSRINLNLSNASVCSQNAPAMNTACRLISRSLDFVPMGSQIKSIGRGIFSAVAPQDGSSRNRDQSTIENKQALDQIKGRNFEVPGCGGFTLTGRAENLEDYYQGGKEVVSFEDAEDLVKKVYYYLDHDEERAAIAQAGYERTMHEHTYVHRFNEIFDCIGLPCQPVDVLLSGDAKPGRTDEVR